MLGIDLGTHTSKIGVSTEAALTSLSVASVFPAATVRPLLRHLTGAANQEGAVFLLVHLAELARIHLGADSKRAVVCVPAWFDEAQRQALFSCCLRAGLELASLISTPQAIALRIQKERKQRAVIVEVGAGGMSASMVLMGDGDAEVIASACDGNLGGEDVDDAIMRAAMRDVGMIKDSIADAAELTQLRAACETSKREFCAAPPVEKTARLDTFIEPLLARVEDCCRQLLEETQLSTAELDAIYLAGEMGKSPLVRARVELCFLREVEDVPSEAAALGAATFDLSPGTEVQNEPEPEPEPKPESVREPEPESVREPEPEVDRAPAKPRRARTPLPLSEVLKNGKIWNPTKATEILELPFAQPLCEEDTMPFALPLLLARGLARREVTGTITLSNGTVSIPIPVHSGNGCIEKRALSALGLAFKWTTGTFRFVSTVEPPKRGAEMQSLIALAMRGLKNVVRQMPEEELIAAFGGRMLQPANIPADRVERLSRLELTSQEKNFTKHALNGARPLREVLSSAGLGKQSGLVLVLLLTAFGYVDFEKNTSRAA